MSTPASWGRYSELHPDALAHIRATAPVAYLPWGSLEWHGPHLPFGVAGLIAESITERVAQRVGGVLLPTTWWSGDTVPHRDSLSLPNQTPATLWDGIFSELARAEWRVIVVISGHYVYSHDLILMEAAERAIKTYQLPVLAIPPLALVDEAMLDHSALWETSLIMALRPDLVDLTKLGSAPINPTTSSVIGRDPRGSASVSIGNSAVSLAVERLCTAIGQLLAEGDSKPLLALYERRREHYRSLVERYGAAATSSITDWWADLAGSEPD
jgi:creatinine amidohydrolase